MKGRNFMSSNNTPTRKSYIQSVERALDVLEILANSEVPMRSGEIAKKLGLSPGTANNLIRTLYMRKYLEQNKNNTYTLGIQSFFVGSAADIWRKLRIASIDVLQELCNESNALSFLGALHQHEMIAVNVARSNAPISIALNQNWLNQCHSTASGKVLLSTLSEDEYTDFINHYPLTRFTGRTVCDPEVLRQELKLVRLNGYSVVQDESVFGISSIGVPICGEDWRPIAALSISFSSYFLNDQYLQRQLALLNKYRHKLEKKLLS